MSRAIKCRTAISQQIRRTIGALRRAPIDAGGARRTSPWAWVALEVTLPWLLARFAHAVQRVVGQRGQVSLEKK
jgi:hypothetical protein